MRETRVAAASTANRRPASPANAPRARGEVTSTLIAGRHAPATTPPATPSASFSHEVRRSSRTSFTGARSPALGDDRQRGGDAAPGRVERLAGVALVRLDEGETGPREQREQLGQ